MKMSRDYEGSVIKFVFIKIYLTLFKITTRTRGSFMQKEFTIQDFFVLTRQDMDW